MSWSHELENVGNEIVEGLEKRIQELRQLEKQIEKMLAEYKNEREKMYESLKEMLTSDRRELAQEVKELLDSYSSERLYAQKAWSNTMKKLKNIR